VYCFLNSRHALRERQRRRKFFNLERGMKREVKELFAKAERTKERLDEMMAELSDSLIKLLNSEISVEEHKAKSKAVQNAQKAWKQQMDAALKTLLLARREAASNRAMVVVGVSSPMSSRTTSFACLSVRSPKKTG
jgi:hypothetical protein